MICAVTTKMLNFLPSLGLVSPKLSQLGRQLTERQLDYKLNSSFRFTNVRHVKSNLRQLTHDYAFSLAELRLVTFVMLPW